MQLTPNNAYFALRWREKSEALEEKDNSPEEVGLGGMEPEEELPEEAETSKEAASGYHTSHRVFKTNKRRSVGAAKNDHSYVVVLG